MIVEGVRAQGREEETAVCRKDFFTPAKILVPAVATSLDALAVGASLAFTGNGVWGPAGAMGIVTAAVSFAGVELGYRLKSFGGEKYMSTVGGAIILLIGVKILLEHCC